MTREEKNKLIEDLDVLLNENKNFYLADISGLTAEESSDLRRLCFKRDVSLRVVKNTLLQKAMERNDSDFEEFYQTLIGNTSIMFTEVGNSPAKIIKEFRKKHNKPILKAAIIENCFYLGDENLNSLVELKSREEFIAEIISLLQSPAKNVISSLQSGGNKLSGIVTALKEKEDQEPVAEETAEEPEVEETAEEPEAEETTEEPEAEETAEEPEAEETAEEPEAEETAEEPEAEDDKQEKEKEN
jgi:large subunit ribosomal protein L10